MDAHSIEVLEFATVIGELRSLCFSQAADASLAAQFIESDRGFGELRPRWSDIQAACAILRQGMARSGEAINQRLEDISGLRDLLDKPGMVLELEELAAFHRQVKSGGQIIATLRKLTQLGLETGGGANPQVVPAGQLPGGQALLESALSRYPDLRSLEKTLDFYLDGSGALKEDQVPELRQARGRIAQAQADLRKAAGQIIAENAQYTSAEVATLRDGRTVIPLKADFRGRLKGIVHQSSASGATLFVEPFELVDRNNACAEAEGLWAQAVHAILRQLSAKLAAAAAPLDEAQSALVDLDLLYCRARYAQSHDCFPASLGTTVNLCQARHPLLDRKAIPIDIAYSEGRPLMVISGPNTGGKTVALKTLGLLAMMNQAGLAIPAALGSSLPWFDHIFADIGDEQSISASLSTFSGHISRISGFLDRLDRHSLVLLDELGSGTDPAEGAALAVAVTEHLLQVGCHTLITSHHGALKALAFAAAGAINASMEFSQAELRPTYKVVVGLPGQSHALDIAQRVGFSAALLQRAREFLGSRETPLEDLVRSLTEQQRELQQARQELERQSAVLMAREAEMAERGRQIAERELEIKRDQSQQSGAFLQQARSQVESVLRELGAFRAELNEQQQAALQEIAKQSRQAMADLSQAQSDAAQALRDLALRDLSDQDLRPGLEVWIRNSSQHGVLDREVKPGRWLVLVQNKAIEFKLEQLQLSQRPSPKKPAAPKKRVSYSLEGGQPAAFSLDVRGMRVTECQDVIIRQIDMAMMQGRDYFSIIHGKGEGILQKAIHDYLRDCPGVERFEFARPEDGGSGKTQVFLRH